LELRPQTLFSEPRSPVSARSSANLDDWNSEIWNERTFTSKNGSLVEAWNLQSDCKPEPNSDFGGQNKDGLFGWEPVFHAALWNGYVFVSGLGGTIYKVNVTSG
jgi:hypothetical protein